MHDAPDHTPLYEVSKNKLAQVPTIRYCHGQAPRPPIFPTDDQAITLSAVPIQQPRSPGAYQNQGAVRQPGRDGRLASRWTACSSPAWCNEQGRVTKFFLSGLNITYTLPPAIGELARPAGDAQHNQHAGPARPHPGPDSFGNLSHLSISSTSWSPPCRAPPRRRSPAPTSPPSASSAALAERPDPRVAAEAALLHLLRREVQRPRRAHPAAAGARRHAPPASRPLGLMLDGNRLSGTIPWTYALERHVMVFTVANNSQQAHRRPVVPLRPAVQDGDRRHRPPVREQLPVQPHRRGDAHAAVVPEPEPRPDLWRRAGVAAGHEGGRAGPQLQPAALRGDTYRRPYGAVQGGGVRAQQVPVRDAAAAVRQRQLSRMKLPSAVLLCRYMLLQFVVGFDSFFLEHVGFDS
ncbi:hypothetical protein BS78_06G132200 [Paspalum vaginatum]|nr:hypothetical protein BS78_06G132200 [Paspalum vaginatum]